MTNIDIILAVGLLISLGAAVISILLCMQMHSDVAKCSFEIQILYQVCENHSKTYDNILKALDSTKNMVNKVLEHDRQVIDDDTKIMTEMAKLQARLEDMDDNS